MKFGSKKWTLYRLHTYNSVAWMTIKARFAYSLLGVSQYFNKLHGQVAKSRRVRDQLAWLYDWREEHFHLTRLRGRRPLLAYSADRLQTNRNNTLSFLSDPSLGSRISRCIYSLQNWTMTFKLSKVRDNTHKYRNPTNPINA